MWIHLTDEEADKILGDLVPPDPNPAFDKLAHLIAAAKHMEGSPYHKKAVELASMIYGDVSNNREVSVDADAPISDADTHMFVGMWGLVPKALLGLDTPVRPAPAPAPPPVPAKPAVPAGGVYLALFHGRKTLTEDLDDWGDRGPILGPFNYLHTTYASDIKFEYNGQSEDLSIVEDLVYYDGMFYGDWSAFVPPPEGMTEDEKKRCVPFDRTKAVPVRRTVKLVIDDRQSFILQAAISHLEANLSDVNEALQSEHDVAKISVGGKLGFAVSEVEVHKLWEKTREADAT